MCSSRDALWGAPSSPVTALPWPFAVSDIQLSVTKRFSLSRVVTAVQVQHWHKLSISLCAPLAQHLYFRVSLNQDMSPVKSGLVLQEVHDPWVFFLH